MMTTINTTLSLPVRNGPQPAMRRPTAERPGPHQQLSQNAPLELQEALFALGRSLPGVTTGRSLMSLPGARAFFLDRELARGPDAAFQAGTEFAHIHAPFDGSLHVTLPDQVAQEVMAQGWGEPHPVQKGLLIYGPRDEQELAVAWQLLRISHVFACGAWSIDEAALRGRSS
jgi:hypothetical protein